MANTDIWLSSLIADWLNIPQKLDRKLTGVATDSRLVKAGNLFIARQGIKYNASDFIPQALANGAAAIINQSSEQQKNSQLTTIEHQGKLIPQITIAQLSQYIHQLASRFFDQAADKLDIVGVTGTNGKSSTVNFISQLLAIDNQPSCGLIGTVNYQFADYCQSVINTTPDQLTLQQLCYQFYQRGARQVAMEVSSHGLAQDRVTGLPIKTTVLTNLGEDHLHYHGSLANYAKAKEKLFSLPNVTQMVINLDDKFGKFLLNKYNQLKTVAYAINYNIKQPIVADYYLFANNIEKIESGITFKLVSSWGSTEVNVKLFTLFDIQNLLAAIGASLLLGADWDSVLYKISQLTLPAGRMELFTKTIMQPKVFVDYAHNPDGLAQVLTELRSRCLGDLWCVFGCGGERDQARRASMGAIAEQLADQVIITNDNPRSEDPQKIAADILAGVSNQDKQVLLLLDRTQAISYAVQHAKSNDIVLITGKGHEDYQEINGKRYPFSDRYLVAKLLKYKP